MTSNFQCGPCNRREKRSVASKWCVDCEDALCNDCVTAHIVSKASMHHQLRKATSALPTDVEIPTRQCVKHPKFIVEFFCTNHDSVCCKLCIAKVHQSCDNVLPIETASENAKSSDRFRDFYVAINYIRETLKGALQSRFDNKVKIESEEKSITESISLLKTRFINKIDELETTTLSQLKRCKRDADNKITNDEIEIKKSLEQMEKYLRQLNFFAENRSNNQLFLLLHQLQPQIAQEQFNVETFLSQLSNISLVYIDILTIFKLKDIGSIMSEISKVEVKCKASKYLKAQAISTELITSPKSFQFSNSIEGQFNEITGIIVDEDNNLLIVDRNRLLMYNQECEYIKECQLGSESWGIAQHPESGKIVVSSRSRSTQFVSNFAAQPPTAGPGHKYGVGVTWFEHEICVGGENGWIHVLDSKGNYQRRIKTKAGTICYLYYKDNGTVYFSDNSKMYWMYEDGDYVFCKPSGLLKGPVGITADRNRYLYVAGNRSHTILRLTPEGKDKTVVLGKKDGIKNPYALCFSRDYKKLFVSINNGRKLVVFNCVY